MFQYALQTAVNNVHDKIILECDWLSPAKLEHQQDSVCIRLAIGLCNRTVTGTINMLCLYKWTASLKCMCCSCTFCQVDGFFLTYNRCLVSFSKGFD